MPTSSIVYDAVMSHCISRTIVRVMYALSSFSQSNSLSFQLLSTIKMGKVKRVAFLFTPWILTAAACICTALITLSGWNKGTLPNYYFVKVDFTNLNVSGASGPDDRTSLAAALEAVQGDLADIYEIHLWNYCNSSHSTTTNKTLQQCSERTACFTFDIISTWGLNITTSDSANTYLNRAMHNSTAKSQVKLKQLEDKLLGSNASKALEVYHELGKSMSRLYTASFWVTCGTLLVALLAFCSRIGSLCTWISAILSSLVNTLAVSISIAAYIALVGGLRGLFDGYNVQVDLGRDAMIIAGLSVGFNWTATLLWSCGLCCGR